MIIRLLLCRYTMSYKIILLLNKIIIIIGIIYIYRYSLNLDYYYQGILITHKDYLQKYRYMF